MYVLIDYSYISVSLIVHFRITSCLYPVSRQIVSSEIPLLNLSRMVRPAGRGRGANDNHPPPPDYMAGMMQQFELNHQFMENIMARFPRPNMNQQPAQVTLQDFMRLNPTVYHSST